MIQAITLDDSTGTAVTIHDPSASGKRGITKAAGLVGIAAPRTSQRVRPNAHGGINETRYEDGKLIVLDGEIVSNVSLADALNEFRTVCAPMEDTLDFGAALLKWTEGATANLTNYIANPSFESTDISAWTNEGTAATLTRDTATVRAGSGSLRIDSTVTNGHAAYSYTTTANGTYSAGAYVWAPLGKSLRLDIFSSVVTVVATASFTGTGDWQWVSVTGTTGASITSVQMKVRSLEATALTFYVDTAVMVAGSSVTYFDGNTFGAEWMGQPDASMSQLNPGKQRLVKVNGNVEPEFSDNSATVNYQAQFYAEDPRAYSQILTTVTGANLTAASGGLTFKAPFKWKFTPSGAGAASCTNAGNRSTPPIIRIYGYAVNPSVLNVATGARIVLSGTVAAGDYLELDTYAHTVKLNGVTNRASFIDSSNTTWFELPRNATTSLRLLSATFDATARIDVLFRSAYS